MKNRKILMWLDKNILIAGIFLCAALLIFVQSYWFGAYISPDSTNYLRAAQSLRDGYGLYVNAAAGDTGTYFSIWPIGYPAMIALVSLVTGTEIYLASKILSIIILAAICGMFCFRFRETAWVYALIVTNLGFLQIFWYTWSEQPFILGLIWISFSAADILNSEHIRLSHYVSICLASLLLFFSRYIGAFSVGVIGILAVYYLFLGISRQKKEHIKKALLLTTVMFIVAVAIVVYLYTNKLKSGYMTGMERIPITEHPLVLFIKLCKACLDEIRNVFYSFFRLSYGLTIILCIISVICCSYFRLHIRFRRYISVQAVSLLIIGLLYWCSIVAMRFSANFDSFSYRLLFPASALFFLGIVSIILTYKDAWIYKINSTSLKYILFIIILASLFSYSLPAIHNIYKHEGNINGYAKIRADIVKELLPIPSGSLVITRGGFKESYVKFIRPDLIMITLTWPLPIERYQSEIDQAEGVYVYLDWEHLQPDDTFFPLYRESNTRLIQIK
ncbi:hypothetical protein Holit_02506 [Hollandina sp. SP2]